MPRLKTFLGQQWIQYFEEEEEKEEDMNGWMNEQMNELMNLENAENCPGLIHAFGAVLFKLRSGWI